MGSRYLGSGGRLSGGPAPELVESGYHQEISHAPRLAAALSWADTAHAVALAEGGGIDPATAADLLRGLTELDAIPADQFPWNAAMGDAFNSREAELTRRVGPAAAGWLSAGRPRREAFRVGVRLVARADTVELHDALVDQAAALAALAARHRDALAADYTYLQPAQPSTVGHLLLAYAYPALRDARRLRDLHEELQRSVAGVGGSAGSRWPLDRQRLAALLGCRGLVEHAKDAAWQTDVYAALASAVAIACTHSSQLAQDLEIFASQEFGIARLADPHSRASALMPQKRNPYALAVVRTMAGSAAGALTGMLVALHTGSARTDHFHHINGAIPALMDDAVRTARLMARVIEGLEIDAERMAQVARQGFTVAADISDLVAQQCGLDYRTAHHVVGRAVREATEAGIPPGDISAADIVAAANLVGHPITLDDQAFAAARDPLRCALERLQEGSSSPQAMEAMLEGITTQVGEARQWSDRARADHREGRAALDAAVVSLTRSAARD